MHRFVNYAALALVAGTVLLWTGERATAVVVAVNDAPKDANMAGANLFRDFPSGDWYTDDTLKASDGNEFMGYYIPLGEGNGQDGYAWEVEKTLYDTALGHPLANGNVVRHSVWIATDPSDPLVTSGAFTDSLKFEFATVFGCGSGGCEYFDTGNLIPIDFAPTSTDPGLVTSTGWTQISMQYVIDDLDFTGPLENLLVIRPVLFIGEFNSDVNNGTLYIDRVMVEVFEDLATANATPLDPTYPGEYLPAMGLDGDYNGDGKVDASDYVMWRNSPGDFGGTPDGYNTWRGNFAASAGSGAGLGGNAVPEPSSVLLVLLSAVSAACVRFRNRAGG